MTNKEASIVMKSYMENPNVYEKLAFDMAIKALEQEPCEDAISRQVVLDYIESEYKGKANESLAHEIVNIMAIIDSVPPVNTWAKVGHWIYDEGYSDWDYSNYKCSCCKREITIPYDIRNEVYKEYPYCNCGAKMVDFPDTNIGKMEIPTDSEPQEREKQE